MPALSYEVRTYVAYQSPSRKCNDAITITIAIATYFRHKELVMAVQHELLLHLNQAMMRTNKSNIRNIGGEDFSQSLRELGL
jgi:hypothetical protein